MIFFLYGGVAFAEGAYKAVEVEGSVKVWSPVASDWTEIEKGSVFPEGSLAQFGKKARLKAAPHGWGGRRLEFEPRSPAVFRLSPQSQRTMKLEAYHVSMSDHTGGSEDKDGDGLLSLSAAWSAVLDLFGKSDKGNAEFQSKIPSGSPVMNDQKSMAAKSQPEPGIELEHPRHGSTFVVTQWPTMIGVRWEPVEGVKTYEVRYRRDLKGEDVVAGETRKTQFKLKIREPGRYSVRILTPDDGPSSRVSKFLVTNLEGITRRKKPSEGTLNMQKQFEKLKEQEQKKSSSSK